MAGFRLMLRIIVIVVGFAAVVVGALSKAEVLPPEWETEPALLIVAGAVASIDALIGIFGTRASKTGLEREVKLEKAVRASLIAVARATGTDVIALGGSVFEVKRMGFLRKKRLNRLVRSRMSDSPQESTITWTAGKGAIGDAWEQKKTVHRDWVGVARAYGDASITQPSFQRIAENTRDGFSFTDFRTIVGKYAEILAVPVLKSGRCVGVLALDVPYSGQETTCLGSKEVREIAETCAQVLSNVIR